MNLLLVAAYGRQDLNQVFLEKDTVALLYYF